MKRVYHNFGPDFGVWVELPVGRQLTPSFRRFVVPDSDEDFRKLIRRILRGE